MGVRHVSPVEERLAECRLSKLCLALVVQHGAEVAQRLCRVCANT